MTLKASPPWIFVTLTTPASSGSTLRATMVCSAVTICAAATMGSMPRWGMAPWAPVPSTVMVNSSQAAIMGPVRTAISPAGRPGQLCMP